jgi:hypothetical protein
LSCYLKFVYDLTNFGERERERQRERDRDRERDR